MIWLIPTAKARAQLSTQCTRRTLVISLLGNPTQPISHPIGRRSVTFVPYKSAECTYAIDRGNPESWGAVCIMALTSQGRPSSAICKRRTASCSVGVHSTYHNLFANRLQRLRLDSEGDTRRNYLMLSDNSAYRRLRVT